MIRLAALALVLVLLTTPRAAEAQPAKIALIGVLSGGSAEPSPLLDAFRQSLRDLGHVEGKTILIEYRFAEAKPERLPMLATELVRLGVDVIVAINTPASQAAKAATRTIPIVFTWVVDPLSLVASLARPGGNVTGLTSLISTQRTANTTLRSASGTGSSRDASRVAHSDTSWNGTRPTSRSWRRTGSSRGTANR